MSKNTAFAIFRQFLVILVKMPPSPHQETLYGEPCSKGLVFFIANLDGKCSLNLSLGKVLVL